MGPLMKRTHNLPLLRLHHLHGSSCSSASSPQSAGGWGEKQRSQSASGTAGNLTIMVTIQLGGRQYRNRLSNPCQFALGLLLPLGVGNFWSLLRQYIVLFDVLVILGLLYCKVWASIWKWKSLKQARKVCLQSFKQSPSALRKAQNTFKDNEK